LKDHFPGVLIVALLLVLIGAVLWPEKDEPETTSVDYYSAYSEGYQDALSRAQSHMEDYYSDLTEKFKTERAVAVMQEFDECGFEIHTEEKVKEAGLALAAFYDLIYVGISEIDDLG
jgi:hypothetical protein